MALSKCFYCISLKMGSFIIGILSLIVCLMILVITCVVSGGINSLVEPTTENYAIIRAFIKSCNVGIITYVILSTILTIIFIIGVVKMNHKLILPYLCVAFTNSLTIVSIGISLMTMASTFPVGNRQIWGYFVQYLCSSMIYIYLMMVVYYYYREVKSGIHHGVVYQP